MRMYRNREDGFVLTDIILQILFFVLFIFALIWLFPTKGFIKNMEKQISGNSIDYQVLSNRIFNENLLDMKVAAESYYTTPRLPKNTGDKVSMTLGEMIDKKLLLSIQDKNGNNCDMNNSYVEIIKRADEYELKVVLSCSGKEDYLVVHLGCYQYCENDVCEKESDMNIVTNTKPTQTTVIKNIVTTERPIINNNITINNDCVNCEEGPIRTEPVYYCKNINGKYYGKNGNLVDSTTYQKECIVEPVYYCKYVNGKYYGKNGNIVDSATYQKECIVEPVYYCKYVDGKYYGKNGNVVDSTTYQKECIVEPIYYCKYVNGKYYGKNGNVVDSATYQKECIKQPEPTKTLYYEYRTKTLVANEVATKMCTYYPVEEASKYIYTLGYTGISTTDISRYPYAVTLPAGATNVQIDRISYGQETFNLSAWKNLKANGSIYNYEYNDSKWSAKDTITTTRFKNSALSKKHFSDVRVLKTKTISYSNYVEYRIDYRVLFNRANILKDRYLYTYNDSNVGNIYYVPIRFHLTYDIVSSKTNTKPCSSLTKKENNQVIKRYTHYDVEKSYEYGPRKWTLNPNLKGVEYTGKTEWR